MAPSIDLDAYFERINYAGDRSPTLETLQSLHLRHAVSIPFENLSPLLREPARLDLPSLQLKLVQNRRGGYCFEHNLLFAAVLDQLGFEVRKLAARVVWNAPNAEMPPRSHMLLQVDVDGQPYLADVGFGGLTLTGPIRQKVDVEQPTPHEPFRLIAEEEDYVMQAKLGDKWGSLYRFDLQRQYQADYEVSSWYLSNFTESLFMTSLLAARPLPDRRYALFNNAFVVHHLGGPSERRFLKDAADLRETLQGPFGIALPETPQLDEVLKRLIVASD